MKKRNLILVIIGIILLIVVTNVTIRYSNIRSVNFSVKYPTEDHIISLPEIQQSLAKRFGDLTQKKRREISTEDIRVYLESKNFVSKADIAVTMLGKLNIVIYESEPIVRVYPKTGDDFYLDKDFHVLKVVENHPSHTMIATGDFPRVENLKVDSLKNILKSLYDLSTIIRNDSILKYQIDQIDYHDTTFILIPKIGDYSIILGSKNNWEDELLRLHHLYKSSFIHSDWQQYSKIDLRFSEQVVCTRKEDNK
ncbi:MAG: hypothetical protein KBT03_08750 [Bacteroidales bacterium]|nr:hypothetical protein [Candidatus Scybalousia scybalohippi]